MMYAATLRGLETSLASQFMNADPAAHATTAARSVRAGRPFLAKPSASIPKISMARSRDSASITLGQFSCRAPNRYCRCAA